MSDSSSGVSAPLKLIIRLLLTIALVWGMSSLMERYFFVSGGIAAYIIVGSLLTLMNVLVRPLLHLISLPFKLFAVIIAIIIVNGGFLWLTMEIAEALDPDIVQLHIDGGVGGWILVALILGIANWVFREILK